MTAEVLGDVGYEEVEVETVENDWNSMTQFFKVKDRYLLASSMKRRIAIYNIRNS